MTILTTIILTAVGVSLLVGMLSVFSMVFLGIAPETYAGRFPRWAGKWIGGAMVGALVLTAVFYALGMIDYGRKAGSVALFFAVSLAAAWLGTAAAFRVASIFALFAGVQANGQDANKLAVP